MLTLVLGPRTHGGKLVGLSQSGNRVDKQKDLQREIDEESVMHPIKSSHCQESFCPVKVVLFRLLRCPITKSRVQVADIEVLGPTYLSEDSGS